MKKIVFILLVLVSLCSCNSSNKVTNWDIDSFNLDGTITLSLHENYRSHVAKKVIVSESSFKEMKELSNKGELYFDFFENNK